MSNDMPYPNIVVEIAVNNESAMKLRNNFQRYFIATISVCLWIGIKYSTASKKFWVGFVVRYPDGVEATITSQFQLPSNHHDINISMNIVYSMPMMTVFGLEIPFLQGIADNAVLRIDIDMIYQTMLNV